MEKVIKNRITILVLIVVVMSSAIGARLYDLQITRSEEFLTRAQSQHEERLTVPATRGTILDRNRQVLAVSIDSQSLYAHPRRIEDPRRYAELLAPILSTSKRDLLKRLGSDKSFVYLQRFLDTEQLAAVKKLDLPIGGPNPFGFLKEAKRYYPAGQSAVHVVGYANTDGIGVEGIEKQFEFDLQGDSTVVLVQKDARHNKRSRTVKSPEKQPLDLMLSIDLVLQHISMSELKTAIKETGAKAGSVILLDPRNGQVLALANWPAADPNRYGRARPDERINRTLVHYYEPGSTFKIVPLAAALEHDLVWPGKQFNCENGVMRTGRRLIRDTSAHGMLTVREILAESSCIGMVKITQGLKPEALSEMIERFGFGQKTSIELPGESQGSVPPTDRWSSFTQASMSFGQEIGVTVIQMASAMGVIANDGILVPPRITLGTLDRENVLHAFGRPPERRILSSETASQIDTMLRGVVTGGTGKRANLPSYTIAGKTGTAQKATPGGGYSEYDYVASFAGYGPASAPELVCLVVLDSPPGHWHQGGTVAAPVFARIISRALHYLRVPYDRGTPALVKLPELSTGDTPAPRQGVTKTTRNRNMERSQQEWPL